MSSSVNKIRNADFSRGKPDPNSWMWSASSKQARWKRGLPDQPGDLGGIMILIRRHAGTASWSQTVGCQPGKSYRTEATVTCDLTAADTTTPDESVGLVLAAEPVAGHRSLGEPRVTPGLHRALEPIAVRTYYKAPDNARRLKVSVGVVNMRGTAHIHNVRLIEILDPEEMSHILAIPAPSYALPAPRVTERVSICSATATDRPITCLLSKCFSDSNVGILGPEELQGTGVKGEAILLPDGAPPPSIRSLTSLLKLAADRIVVISLPAIAKLTNNVLSVRRVEQDDDPIHAKVSHASHATRGFALNDIFPYAWPGHAIGSFVQNHFRKTTALKDFCEKHGFITLLESMCDQDATSDRPICLYKQTRGGGLFVLDIEPAEARGSTFAEPTLAMHLLLSILGRSQNSLGQYVVPAETEAEFRELIRDAEVRFEPFVVHDADVPTEEVTEQLVTIGREDQSYGQPLTPKPVILVRSGLTSGDAESVYGAFLWFKQFGRMEPHVCPYAQRLASQFRLAWVPLVAPWEARGGWRRSSRPPVEKMTIDTEGAKIAALVDVASCPANEVGVVLPSHEGAYQRYAEWLPRIIAAFTPGQYFVPGVDDREAFCDRSQFEWRHLRHDVQVIVDPETFQTDAHRHVTSGGGQVIRIEIPGYDADFAANSIQRTDLAATLLEHVIGLQYGLIAVNRQPTPVHFDGFPPVGSGQALVIDRRDPMLKVDASQVG